MAKTRIQKIENIESQMEQMKHNRDRLIAEQKVADRKARDHRICQRGAGAVVKAAYHSGDTLTNDYDGRTFDYARKNRVV
jgi:hypothetical protein